MVSQIALEAATKRRDAEKLKLTGKPEDQEEAQKVTVYAERLEADLDLPMKFLCPTETIAGAPPFGPHAADTPEDKDLVAAIRNPSLTIATARIHSLRQTQAAGVLEQALALAEEVKAHGGIERMITDEMAAAHGGGMALAGLSAYHAYNASRQPDGPYVNTSSYDGESRMAIRLQHNAAAARAALAAARMFDAVQNAALTLQELKKGKRGKMKYVVEKTVYVTGPKAGGGAREAGETVKPTGEVQKSKLRRTL